MTPALKAMVEAMAAELQRQNQAELERMDGGDENGEGGPVVVGDLHDGVSCYVDGDIDLEKVARAGLEAIPADELAVAISAALAPGDFYVFGTTDGIEPGQREDLTSIGIDGTGDLVETAGRTLRALVTGVEWKAGANGVLVAYFPDDHSPPR